MRYHNKIRILLGILCLVLLLAGCTPVPVEQESASETTVSLSDNMAVRDTYEEYAPDYLISDCLKNLRRIQPPNLWKNALILGIFLLLIPVLFFLLKRFDRQKWIWAVIPALSLVMTFVVFVANRELRVHDPIATSLTILESDGETVKERSMIGVTVPDTRPTQITANVDPEQVYLYPGDEFYAYEAVAASGFFDRNQVRKDEKGVQLCLQGTETFAQTILIAPGEEKAGTTGLELTVSRSAGRLEGMLTNNTGYDLQMVSIYTSEKYITIGAMEAGETVRFERSKDSCSLEYFTEMDSALESGTQGSHGIWMAWEIATDLTVYEIDPREVVVFAYIQDPDRDYFPDPKIAENNAAAIVIRKQVPYTEGDSFGAVWLTDYDVKDENYISLNTEQIDVEYQPEYDTVYGFRIGPRPRDNDAEFTLQLYNYRTSQYDEVQDGTGEVFAAEDYCSANGKIRVIVEVTNGYYIPDILAYVDIGTENER